MKSASRQDKGLVRNQDFHGDVPSVTVSHEEKDKNDKTEIITATETKTPDKQIRQNSSINYSENKTNQTSAVTVTPSPQVLKKKGKASKSYPTSGKHDNTLSNKIDKATGLSIETLNNLHRLLPNAKKPVIRNHQIRKDPEQVIPTSPLTRAMNPQEIWEATGAIRTKTAVPSPEDLRFSKSPLQLTPMQKLQKPKEKFHSESGGSELLKKKRSKTVKKATIHKSHRSLKKSSSMTSSATRDTANLVSQLEATILIRRLKEANEHLCATVNRIMKRTHELDNLCRQKSIDLNAYRARSEALQEQLETEIKARKALEKRTEKYISTKSRRAGVLSTKREVLENRVRELELSLITEKDDAMNLFLEREDELLNLIQRKRSMFDKDRHALIKANAKLKAANRVLMEQLSKAKRKIQDSDQSSKKRIKM